MGLGEFELIAGLLGRLPPPGPEVRVPSGDDAAVTDRDGPLVVTVDAIVEGVHFTRPAFTPRAVGRKALAAALSDLAAMGAEPGEAYVVLGVPPDADDAELLELGDGIAEVATREGVSVIGGDVTRSPALLVSVTAIGGEREDTPLVERSGAGAGDVVVITGELGGAAGALPLLERDRSELDPPLRALLDRQLDPRPRIAVGWALAAAGATAMIDVSDGLGADAGHLAESSGVRLELELELVPVSSALEAANGRVEALRLAASGGEDYELLACVPPDALERAIEAVTAIGCALTPIGRVVEGEGVAITDRAGKPVEAGGYDHLRRGGYQ